jgi:hypothetical protein
MTLFPTGDFCVPYNIYIKRERQCTYKRNIEALPRYELCCGKTIILKYSEPVSVLQLCSKRSACAMLSSVLSPAVKHVFSLAHKRHVFRKKHYGTNCVFFFSTNFSEIFLSLSRIQRDIVVNVIGSSRQVPLFFSDLNETYIFRDTF